MTAAATALRVLRQEWKQLTLTCVAIITVFTGATVTSRLYPQSPWPALFAGLPTGLISIYLLTPTAFPSFVKHYLTTSTVLWTCAVLLYLTARAYPGLHQTLLATALLGTWATLNCAFNK
jgi:hypothetical protein